MWLLQKVHIPLPQIFPLIENPPSPTLPVPQPTPSPTISRETDWDSRQRNIHIPATRAVAKPL